MFRRRTVLTLIVVPAIVSLLVTLLVLYFWDRQQGPEYIMLPTYSSTALIPPRMAQPVGAGAGSAEVSADSEVTPSDSTEGLSPCENPVHVVQSGETLGAIATAYGVSVDDVAAINRLLDPNFNSDLLSVGQQVVIPVCGIPTPTSTLSPTPTLVPTRNIPTPIATATPLPPGVVRVRIARVLDPGDVTTESVEIINEGSSVARLEGWTLTNGQGMRYVFPQFNLFPQGAVVVHSGVGEDTALDLYWGLGTAVWEPGDTVQLLDAEGNLQAELEVTP